jgi:hypothetical protein
MLRILTASSLLALTVTSASAQNAGPAAQPSSSQPSSGSSGTQSEPGSSTMPQSDSHSTSTEPSSSMSIQPSTSTPADPLSQTAPSASAAPTPEPKEITVKKLVDAEFPAYDANSSGDLEQVEFSKWVLALHGASGDPKAAAMDDAAKAQWAKAAFTSADADKSKKVSKAEMSTFLAG